MLPGLLLTMAAASALGPLPPDCGVATWRAGPSLVRVELDRGGKLNALTRSMWEALDAVLEDTDDALLITSGDAKAFSAGADVNAVDNTGSTAMMKAAYNGHDTILKMMIESGVLGSGVLGSGC